MVVTADDALARARGISIQEWHFTILCRGRPLSTQNRTGQDVLHNAPRRDLFTLQHATPRAGNRISRTRWPQLVRYTTAEREKERKRVKERDHEELSLHASGYRATFWLCEEDKSNEKGEEERKERATSRGINAEPSRAESN